MARTLKSDRLLFWATAFLVGASLVMVYSASASQTIERPDTPYYQLLSVKQVLWGLIGVGLLFAAMRVDYHEYRRPALIWAVMAVVVLALLAVFLFAPRNHTQRWITLGPVSLQPSELAKLAVIVFAAALLERRMHRVNEVGYALVPVGIVTLTIAGLVVLEPDFGTAAMLVLVAAAMVFAAGLSYRYVLGTALLLLPVATMLIAGSAYRRRRLLAFLDPWRDPLGDGFQIIQSLIAVGSGGTLGKGLMGGVQKLFYLPEAHNDFIFAVIAEEVGLIGSTVVLAAFVVIAWRGMRTALVAPDRFGSLLAVGLTMMIVLQALVNMSMVIGLLPPKGIPLPFVSSGGSSLVINLVAMGMLLNISQQASATAEAREEGERVRE
jgi:cell division protein FtsW